MIAIESEINPAILKIKLESFLTPSQREPEFVSYAKLRERFNIHVEEGAEQEAAAPIRISDR